jgi:ABC-type uncharacterized transport system substrate-binding protein
MSYSADRVDGFLQAASYINRILRGTIPVDLPVQTPTKYELVINGDFTHAQSGSCEVAQAGRSTPAALATHGCPALHP